jgi:uncharacterized protein (TIGR04222 family)
MDTWGISGGAFLVGYAALLVALFGVGRALRGRVVRDRDGWPPDSAVDVYEIAMLNEGPRLALAAAAASLRDAGALAVAEADGALVAAGPLPPAAHPLEQRVYADVRDGGARAARRLLRGRDPVLDDMSDRLHDLGLVPSARQRAFARAQALWIVPLVVLGGARVAAGSANGKPVGFVVALTGVAAVVAIAWAIDAPAITERGRKLLDAMRADERRAPSLPLAGSLALSGTTAVWAADASLAAAIGLPRETASGGGGWGLGGDGGGGGGCGGCGG